MKAEWLKLGVMLHIGAGKLADQELCVTYNLLRVIYLQQVPFLLILSKLMSLILTILLYLNHDG